MRAKKTTAATPTPAARPAGALVSFVLGVLLSSVGLAAVSVVVTLSVVDVGIVLLLTLDDDSIVFVLKTVVEVTLIENIIVSVDVILISGIRGSMEVAFGSPDPLPPPISIVDIVDSVGMGALLVTDGAMVLIMLTLEVTL